MQSSSPQICSHQGSSLAVSCSALQCVAVCCSALQCVPACCSVLQCKIHAVIFAVNMFLSRLFSRFLPCRCVCASLTRIHTYIHVHTRTFLSRKHFTSEDVLLLAALQVCTYVSYTYTHTHTRTYTDVSIFGSYF